MKNNTKPKRKWLSREVIDASIFFIILALVWEFGVQIFEVKAYLLPALSDIFKEGWSSRDLLWAQSLVTLKEVVLGFALAVILGVVIAALIFFVPIAKRTIYPLMIGLQSIPKIGLAPIIIVWFGYGLGSKVIMAFLFAFFPIIISTLGGLAATPRNLEEHFQALGASGWATFWKLRMPFALPSFMDGCKVAMPLAVIGAIVGEFVGSNDGLGNLILLATGSSNTALTFAALMAVTLMSLLLFFILERLGRFVWWRGL
jgi:NitT/TauT family transport system permease protein